VNIPSVGQQTALWEERLTAAGIPPDGLISRARVGARMVPGDDGGSRLGGTPRMPAGWSWPAWQGRPLQYLARIDLDALARVLSVDQRHGLPAAGALHLFTDALGEGWGFDPEHAGSFAAFLVAADVPVEGFETPGDVRDPDGYEFELELPERRVELVPELVLPDGFADETRSLLGDDQLDAYWDVRDDVLDELFHGAPRHRVCGLPDIVQNPMELECQLASEGVYVGDPTGYQTPRAHELAPGAKDWRLLAQIDSDDDLGLMWGDAGLVYWWLREADFHQGRPERCWGILQCS
jgi:uncharacterized protein YwqG